MKLRAKIFIRNHEMLEARRKLGLNQLKVAKACGVSLNFITKLEKLDYSSLTSEEKLQDLRAVANFLDIPEKKIAPKKVWGRVLTLDRERVSEMSTAQMLETCERKLQLETAIEDRMALQDSIGVFLEKKELKTIISKSLSALAFREREILKLLYGIDGRSVYTYEGVSRLFNIPSIRVRQIEERAIRKLRRPTGRGSLLSILEESSRKEFLKKEEEAKEAAQRQEQRYKTTAWDAAAHFMVRGTGAPTEVQEHYNEEGYCDHCDHKGITHRIFVFYTATGFWVPQKHSDPYIQELQKRKKNNVCSHGVLCGGCLTKSIKLRKDLEKKNRKRKKGEDT